MDNNQIELAARIVFRICEEHPDICPHDYHWIKESDIYEIDDQSYRDITYRCGLCKKEITNRVKVN